MGDQRERTEGGSEREGSRSVHQFAAPSQSQLFRAQLLCLPCGISELREPPPTRFVDGAGLRPLTTAVRGCWHCFPALSGFSPRTDRSVPSFLISCPRRSV